MNEEAPATLQMLDAVPLPAADEGARMILDSRHPVTLDRRGRVLQVMSGHVDVFAIGTVGDEQTTPRQHLFRIEQGSILADVLQGEDPGLRMVAVGSAGAEVGVTSYAGCSDETLRTWMIRLSRLIAGSHPSWDMLEASTLLAVEMKHGERRRGPARNVLFLSVAVGSARLMGQEPTFRAGSPPVPLSSGMWVEAGADSCTLVNAGDPTGPELHAVLDRFHQAAAACLREQLHEAPRLDAERLERRQELTRSRAAELVDRLSAIIVRPSTPVDVASANFSEDPLVAACAAATQELKVQIQSPPGRSSRDRTYDDLVEIARASRLRVRRTQLRRDWWLQDAGPMVGWFGASRDPVALLWSRGRYVMIGLEPGRRRVVERALAPELDPEAASFYPTLPASKLKLRDLLVFSLRFVRGDIARVAIAVTVIGLLSLVTPLITQALVSSVIPRTEIDQLTFCAIALTVTAIAGAGLQAMEGTAMLRLEGRIDWRLQAAGIDRLLKLPASLFREYTVGDFVSRALGIDAVRRILTGQTLRSLLAGLFAWFSVVLMLVYDARLALIGLALLLVRAIAIIGTSALRIYHETRQFNLQGKVEGFVLQILASIGKLRVAAAGVRAMAVWSRQFAVQKRHFIASQRAANALSLFEGSYPTIATLVLFAYAAFAKSTLLQDFGAFLAFLAAFGQAMAGVGMWASGVSASLVAIPHITRIRPLVTAEAEVADDRKPPGALSGAVEFSRVTFRYIAHGPPVIDNVTLRIAPGEYVAIVGPSGSGKSSLFRLMLGFEKPESGAIFFDGKALDTLDVGAVRRQLGVVLQNGRLATGSIFENICGGQPLPLEQAWAAARMAGLDADIKKMPMGMHTAIAEGVNTLSGGQRQRIMIARAVARRPRILLFDEATSSLDNRSQAIVSDALGALNVTRIVIAHRLSTVRQADRIIVLSEGKVMQSGTYAELSEAKGLFADFARRQML
ncbi:NHLP bacteriocin export ABC transporter permease/ATPase subunit [Bradyrhizobium forestalis]|uniref:NHLP bacteriocin export ABC transporter permease/ATPase subunit n=1 Tax=Bradyrhizobium forestalis TaxID=1419263 RepID=A0A2M8R0A5_9BRAD|nr:NHLP bacteriocin export ABC transporter permease/ATPase subunit [Bradyrhizobium forestalis]PJG51252.1 NHLP bacteriocin export ABC transporter permease/ATPase subunit [Bradyrhizobium forestalis]